MHIISKKLKEIHDDLYGRGAMNSVFTGGNVGNAILAESVEKAGADIKDGLIALAKAIESQPEKNTNTGHEHDDELFDDVEREG